MHITVTVELGVTGKAVCVGVHNCRSGFDVAGRAVCVVYITVTVDFDVTGKAVNAGVHYCHSGFWCHR